MKSLSSPMKLFNFEEEQNSPNNKKVTTNLFATLQLVKEPHNNQPINYTNIKLSNIPFYPPISPKMFRRAPKKVNPATGCERKRPVRDCNRRLKESFGLWAHEVQMLRIIQNKYKLCLRALEYFNTHLHLTRHHLKPRRYCNLVKKLSQYLSSQPRLQQWNSYRGDQVSNLFLCTPPTPSDCLNQFIEQ